MSNNKSIAAPTSKPRRLSKQALAKTQKGAKRSIMRVEIRERRYEVRQLRLKGMNPGDIALKLGVEPATISKDLKAIREEQAGEMDEFDRAQHVVEAGERYDMIDQLAHDTYDAAKAGSQTRIKALDLLRLTQGDRTKTMIDTGVIQKEAHRVEVTHSHKLEWDDEMRRKVANALVAQSLTSQLAAPTLEDAENVIDVDSVEDVDSKDPGTLNCETENEEE